jgi:hypothetical protein
MIFCGNKQGALDKLNYVGVSKENYPLITV